MWLYHVKASSHRPLVVVTGAVDPWRVRFAVRLRTEDYMSAIHDNVLNASSVSTNGSAIFSNKQDSKQPFIDLLIRVATAPTGTTPTLTFSVGVSDDGVNFDTVWTGAALTAVGFQRNTWTTLLEPFIQVSWAVGGTTPVFPSVTADLLYSNPSDG